MGRQYSSLDERVLTNIFNRVVSKEPTIYRTKARYGVLDVSAKEFDLILARNGVQTFTDPHSRGRYYLVSEIAAALKNVQDDSTGHMISSLFEEDEENGREGDPEA